MTTLATLINNIKTIKVEDIFTTVVPFKEDPLVLSCFLHRDENSKFKSIHNPDLHKDLTQSDFVQADKILEYYSKKLMMAKLLGKPLTQFREDLSSIIYSDRKELSDDKIGLIHRLPAFYEYDIEFDKFKSNFSSVLNPLSMGYPVKNLNNTNLYFKKYLLTGSLKSPAPHEYWFSDDNNELFLLSVSKTNEIKTVLDFVVKKNKNLIVNVNATFRNRDEFGFWKINTWEII